MRVQIEAFGDVQVSRELLRFSERAEDASPAFRAIADLLRDSEQRQFAGGGRFASGGWAPLAAATKRSKRRNPNPRVRANAERILVATEALRDSLTKQHDPGHVELVGPRELVFGTQSPAARFHQPDPQGRRVIEVRARDRVEMVKLLQRYITVGRV